MPIVKSVREYLGVAGGRRDTTVYVLRPDFDEDCCHVGWKRTSGPAGWQAACARSLQLRREELKDLLLSPHPDPELKPPWQLLLEYCDRGRWAEELGYV